MQMMRAISSHRIFATEHTNTDYIQCIDEIDPYNTHNSCYLPAHDDSARRYKKTEHNGSTVPYESRADTIVSCHQKCRWNNNGEEEILNFLESEDPGPG
jgi:hypothetical protein